MQNSKDIYEPVPYVASLESPPAPRTELFLGRLTPLTSSHAIADPELLEERAARLAEENACLLQEVKRCQAELALAYEKSLEGWCHALDLRDHGTRGHTQRVADLAVQLGRLIGMTEAELTHLRRGAQLHDIGKLGVPDQILLKPGPLSADEWTVMRQHPIFALDMLAHISFLEPALDIPYCHHERWDGAGYPRGLRQEAIPLPARIFAVVDVCDALSSPRPYRPAWPERQVRDYIASQAERQFDPQVSTIFLRMHAAC